MMRFLLKLCFFSVLIARADAKASAKDARGPGAQCLPTWAQKTSGSEPPVCPYGSRLIFDVTWPSEGPRYLAVLCVFYGYVPFLIMFMAAQHLVFKRTTRELSFIAFCGASSAINELVFKRLLLEARPVGSCNLTCGMPSSHSMFSVGFFALMFLDAAMRVNPMFVVEESNWQRETVSSTCFRWFVLPLQLPYNISNERFVRTVLWWLVILLPVPFTRVWLKDHSAPQVIVGSVLGTISACIWHWCVHMRVANIMDDPTWDGWTWPSSWGKWYLLTNNMFIPWWMSRNGVRLDHMMEDDSNKVSNVDTRCRRVTLEVRHGLWSGDAHLQSSSYSLVA